MNRGFMNYSDNNGGADGQLPERADYTSPVYGGATRPLGSAMTRVYGGNGSGAAAAAAAGPISAMGSLRSTRSTAAGGAKQTFGALRRSNNEYMSSPSSPPPAPSGSHLQPFVPDAGERRTPDVYMLGGGAFSSQAGPQTNASTGEYGYQRRLNPATGRPVSSRSTAAQPPGLVTSLPDTSDYYVPRSTSMRKYRIAGEYEDTRSTPPPPLAPSDGYVRSNSPLRQSDRFPHTHGNGSLRRTSSRVQATAPASPPPPSPGAATRAYPSQRVEFGYTSPAMAMMTASRSPERDDEIADIIADMSKTRIAALSDGNNSNGATPNESYNNSSAEEVDSKGKKPTPVRFVYLQLGDDVKKAAVPDSAALSLVVLVNLFIEKYQERLAENPDTVPSIYVKDREQGVFYDLEDIDDVATGSVLQWRPKPLDSGTAALETSEKEGPSGRGTEGGSASAIERDVQALAEAVKSLSATVTQLPAQMKSDIDSMLGTVRQHTDSAVSDAIAKSLGNITALLNKKEDSGHYDAQDGRSIGNSAEPMDVELDGGDTDAHKIASSRKQAITRSASMPPGNSSDLPRLRSKLQKAELALSLARQEHQTALAAVQRERDEIATAMEKLSGDVKTHPNVLRVRIEEGKEMLKADYRALNARFEDAHTLVQEMRKDVTQRGAIPSPQLIKNVGGELEAIRNGTKRLLAFINDTRSDWKRTWEEELQNILKEQSFVKDVEQMLGELDDDTSHLDGVLDKLDKVIDLKLHERSKEGYVPPAATRFLDVVSADDAPEARKDFLMQIACVDIDHSRRLDALEAAEKLRLKELASKVNEFDEELSDFVSQRKLRKTGGTQELERRRAEKDIEVMKDMLKSVEDAELARREKIAQRKAAKKPQPQKKKKKPASVEKNDEEDGVDSEAADLNAEEQTPAPDDHEKQDISENEEEK
ncbi:Bud site selection protein 6 [Coemansia sp. Benny D160-2]|nr:Bud site selection protein 6 [Coemansia sp. Benny D160-2]